MNIANPCKLFLFASTLVVGISVKADGTLPLPIAEANLPYEMNGTLVESTMSLPSVASSFDLSMTLVDASPLPAVDTNSYCGTLDEALFYPATGSVQVAEDDLYKIQGVCWTGELSDDERRIVATKTGRVLSFDGSFVESALSGREFEGQALTIDSVTTSPQSGSTGKKTLKFKLSGE